MQTKRVDHPVYVVITLIVEENWLPPSKPFQGAQQQPWQRKGSFSHLPQAFSSPFPKPPPPFKMNNSSKRALEPEARCRQCSLVLAPTVAIGRARFAAANEPFTFCAEPGCDLFYCQGCSERFEARFAHCGDCHKFYCRERHNVGRSRCQIDDCPIHACRRCRAANDHYHTCAQCRKVVCEAGDCVDGCAECATTFCVDCARAYLNEEQLCPRPQCRH